MTVVTSVCITQAEVHCEHRRRGGLEESLACDSEGIGFDRKGPFTHALRVAAREIATRCISTVAFTHTLRRALMRCAIKTLLVFY